MHIMTPCLDTIYVAAKPSPSWTWAKSFLWWWPLWGCVQPEIKHCDLFMVHQFLDQIFKLHS